jgi:CHAD domain-containing protein
MARPNPSEINPATLSIRLLALLEKASQRAGKGVVHRLRTTVRRLEVHLGTPPPRIAKSLKKLRKKAGKVRDIDVHLGLLEPPLLPARGRSASHSPEVRYREKLQSRLQKQRKRNSTALRAVVKKSTPVLEAELPNLVEQRSEPNMTLQESRKRASRARRRFVQWTRTIPEDAPRLHRLRINAKKLRYEMEPLQNCEEAVALAEKFKQVQDAIGQWHDWATLAEIAEQCLGSKDSASKDTKAAPVLQALHARVEREYRRARRSAETVRNWMMGSSGKAARPAAGTRSSAAATPAGTHGRASLPGRKGPATSGGGPRLIHKVG